MRTKRLTTAEEREEILALYKADVPVKIIAEEYGYSRQTIYTIINRAIVYDRPYVLQRRTIVFPNIDSWLRDNSISISKLADMCGMCYWSIWKVLIGDHTPLPETRKRICNATGLEYEIAFQRYEQEE